VLSVDEMPFEPRKVVIDPQRKFTDFYLVGEEIGRLLIVLAFCVSAIVTSCHKPVASCQGV